MPTIAGVGVQRANERGNRAERAVHADRSVDSAGLIAHRRRWQLTPAETAAVDSARYAAAPLQWFHIGPFGARREHPFLRGSRFCNLPECR